MTLAPPIRIFCLSAMLMAGTAHAQSSEQKVQGYVPPPMFGSSPAAQPRPAAPIVVPGRTSTTRDVSEPVATTGAPLPPASVNGQAVPSAPSGETPAFVKPRISRPNEDGPVKVAPYIPKFPPMEPLPMEDTPAGRGQIVERPRKPLAAPLPGKKPPVPAAVPAPSAAVAPVPVATPVAAPVPPPAAAPIQTQTPPPAPAPAPEIAAPAAPETAQPAYKVTSKGVVTGPKTMPSVGIGGVEKLETFTPDQAAAPGKTLLEQHSERQQAEAKPSAAAAVAPIQTPTPPAGFTPVARIEAVDAGKSRMTLPFTAGQAALSQDQLLTITHNILPIMKGDTGQRVQILAYATPADAGQNSDRRIALSRALAIRDALIKNGVEARRIDVRAHGAAAGDGASDRVDLILSAL